MKAPATGSASVVSLVAYKKRGKDRPALPHFYSLVAVAHRIVANIRASRRSSIHDSWNHHHGGDDDLSPSGQGQCHSGWWRAGHHVQARTGRRSPSSTVSVVDVRPARQPLPHPLRHMYGSAAQHTFTRSPLQCSIACMASTAYVCVYIYRYIYI